MEYVDPKDELGNVTLCFSYFFSYSLPLIIIIFVKGNLPRDNFFGGVFLSLFFFLFALIWDFFLLISLSFSLFPLPFSPLLF